LVGDAGFDLFEGAQAFVDPAGLLGVRRQQGERVGPEFAGLGKEAADFEGAGVLGELVEADALDQGLALGTGERFEGKLDAAVGAVLDRGMGDGRQGNRVLSPSRAARGMIP
jgi:hypothetical protein